MTRFIRVMKGCRANRGMGSQSHKGYVKEANSSQRWGESLDEGRIIIDINFVKFTMNLRVTRHSNDGQQLHIEVYDIIPMVCTATRDIDLE